MTPRIITPEFCMQSPTLPLDTKILAFQVQLLDAQSGHMILMWSQNCSMNAALLRGGYSLFPVFDALEFKCHCLSPLLSISSVGALRSPKGLACGAQLPHSMDPMSELPHGCVHELFKWVVFRKPRSLPPHLYRCTWFLSLEERETLQRCSHCAAVRLLVGHGSMPSNMDGNAFEKVLGDGVSRLFLILWGRVWRVSGKC